MKAIPIKAIKEFAKKYDLTSVVVFAHNMPTGMQYIVTYGQTTEQCSQAADFGNKIKTLLDWPKSLQAQPSRVKRLQKEIRDLKKQIKQDRRNKEGKDEAGQ